MKRLSKLRKLTEYLSAFRLEDWPGIVPVRVVDNENATSQLSKAYGDQLLVALPEARDAGNTTDSFRESVSAAFFALAKINGPARTVKLADETYLRLLEVSQAILDRLEEDLTGGETGMPCPLLAGLSLTDVNVVPEYSIFGGWSGWSVEITLDWSPAARYRYPGAMEWTAG